MHVGLFLRDFIAPGKTLKQKRLVVAKSSLVCVYLMVLLGFGLIPGFILIYVSPGFRAGEINYAFLRMLLPRKSPWFCRVAVPRLSCRCPESAPRMHLKLSELYTFGPWVTMLTSLLSRVQVLV